MPQLLKAIEQFIAEDRQKDTIYIGFNPDYAKVFMGIAHLSDYDDPFMWLDKEKTNWDKREEFKQFMAAELPHIALSDVYDYVPPGYLQWPFLGTIAIDVEVDSPEYHIINNRYEDADGEPKALDAVVFIMSYEDAVQRWKKREELEDLEYGDNSV
jgi:hypothetical protein